jgi:hypothetical protein
LDVAESLRVSESTAQLLDKVLLSVWDSIRISEGNEELIEKFLLSVWDSVRVSEGAEMSLDLLLSTVENLGLSEYVDRRVPVISFSVKEDFGTNEVIGRHELSFIDRSDLVTLSEFVSFFIKNLQASIDEPVRIQEYVNLILSSLADAIVTAEDRARISESIQMLIDRLIRESVDEVRISESVDLIVAKYFASGIENVALSEFLSAVVKQYFVGSFDSARVSESVSVLLDRYIIEPGESAAVSELVSIFVNRYMSGVDENVNITEYIDIVLLGGFSIFLSDRNAISESVAFSLKSYLGTYESANVSELAGLLQRSFIDISESARVSEFSAVSISALLFNIDAGDPLRVSDFVEILVPGYQFQSFDEFGLGEYVNILVLTRITGEIQVSVLMKQVGFGADVKQADAVFTVKQSKVEVERG